MDQHVIEIVDESGIEKGRVVPRYMLYVDGGIKATLLVKGGVPEIVWAVYGPQYWPECKAVIKGLLDLTVLADYYENLRIK